MQEEPKNRGFAKYPQLGIAVMKLMDVLVTIHLENPSETPDEGELMDAMAAAIEVYEKKKFPGSNQDDPA